MFKGTYKDVFPKMLPARNWDPQRPSQPTIALPCPKQAGGSKKLETVLAGMILSATPGATEWTVGVKDGTKPTIIAVAQDGTKGNQSMNVQLADSLVGLPCTGNFRICTPFYKRGVAYAVGTPLTYATDVEEQAASYKSGSGDQMHGCVRPAQTGEPVIGYVVRSQPAKFYGIVNYDDPTGTSATNTTDGAFAMRKSINEAVCSLALSENSYFIEYDTAFQPEAPTA